MGEWKQVSGDMTWERHGIVLGKDEPKYRQVHLVRIDPWIEHDHEAAVTHGLYLVDEKTVDYDDLALDRRDVGGALTSVGMDAEEYEKLEPVHQAEILASYEGYDESRSVDKLGEALPEAPEKIKFWGGPETSEKLQTYDQEMRREALEANFDTRLTFGELPPREAIEFALGGEPVNLQLQGQDALAFNYATDLVEGSGLTDGANEFAETVQALASAPRPDEIEDGLEQVEGILAEWEGRYGNPADEESGIAATAQSLASSLMSCIGFEWV